VAQIRDMTAADLDSVGAVTEAGGFGNRRAFFELILSLGSGRPVVAVEDGRIVGTGLGAIHGEVGWVGVIFVTPDLRGRGLGTALTEAVCARLQSAGCVSLVLVATDLGRPIYEKLGFRVQTRYHMMSGAPLAEAPVPPRGASLRPIVGADIDAIGALDRRATGEQRLPLIRAFAPSGWLLESTAGAADGATSLRGFVLPTMRGNAAVVAPDPQDAVCLLDLHRHLVPSDGHAWAGLVTEHEAGRQLLADRGWYAWRTFPRMIRGPEPEWRPSMIWGQFNHAMG
jgi:GNAT superfamily N-acetyltransferase